MKGESTFRVAEDILGSKDRASEVTKWESGKHFPTPEKLVKIAEHFSCSTDYLLGVTDDSPVFIQSIPSAVQQAVTKPSAVLK